MRYTIGLDVSGGDFAPGAIVEGAVIAQKESGHNITLIGLKEEIESQISFFPQIRDQFNVVYAAERIEMAESPAVSVRRKRNSSIAIGLNSLRDKKIDAFVSCGNTGAVVCAATIILKLIPGVERPGIAITVPTPTGVSLLVDAGANIDPKPMHLLQYGIMSSVYYREVLKKENPSVGLLNIGEESSKGTGFFKNVHKLFSASNLNFVGNIEAKKMFSGECDCIICDGFAGNIALKVAEGSSEFTARFLLETLKKSLIGKVGLLLLRNNLRSFKRKLDYAEYGGAPLFGVDGVVIIGHGRSSSRAVKNAVKVAVEELQRDLNANIKQSINEICQGNEIQKVLTV